MKTFKQLNIKSKNLTGDKIEIIKVLDKEITVTDYRSGDSKYSREGTCTMIQILFEGNTRIIFTGSNVLLEDLEKVPKDSFPFITTIIKTQIDKKMFFLKFT